MLHRPETFERKHSLVAHRGKIISQFKAHSVTGSGHRVKSIRVGSGQVTGQRFRPGSIFGSSYSIRRTVYQVRRSSRSEDMANFRSRLKRLVTFTFDISIYKCGLLCGSPVSWVSFQQIFSLLCPSILYLRSGAGQTDGQTTAPWGGGIILLSSS